MAINNGRNLSGYTADSVANYNQAYQHQRGLGLNDAEAHNVASGLLQPQTTITTTTATTPGAVSTTPTFSNAEVYNIQSQGYKNLGDNAMSNAYGSLANNLGAYSNFANNTLQGYDSLLNFVRNNETGLQNVARGTYNKLITDLEDSRNYVNQMFGPDGELTKEVNQYYDDLGNYLSTDAGRQAAAIAAQGVHSGASLGAIRAQQNAAYNESFGRYVQAKEQQINAKQQLAANLINYMSTLRQEYGDTTNQYIIDLYKRANDMYNSIAQSAAADLNQYNTLMASRVGKGSSGGGTNGTSSGGSNTGDNKSGDISSYFATTNNGKGAYGDTDGRSFDSTVNKLKKSITSAAINSELDSLPSPVKNVTKKLLKNAGILQ